MSKEVDTCVEKAAGPLAPESLPAEGSAPAKEEARMPVARVGGQAPDFEATAYVAGEGFKNIRLSSYRGKWVVLCFYPGDFTFV